ncbi:8509_t:CDS:2 [Paraglomus occultum]|uniref:8509_t:CDS:1 n=1 Tax=Paraglomus occultum TaxID=144539 RepID=A0A9N9CPM2_9GLOM|nr:8509_t:CDS:2 [Paraglomus occultum]
MTHLVSKIEALLLEEPLDSLCGASAVYLAIENNILPPFEYVRGVIDRAVNSSLLKIESNERKTKVLEVLSQLIFNDEYGKCGYLVLVESGYISVRGLKALKALNIEKELYPNRSREEIDENINKLKYKLEANVSNLTWRDPEASMVISDDSFMVKNLGRRQKSTFLEPRENMKCAIPDSVTTKCNEFISNFNNSNTSWVMRNTSHDKMWKEDESTIIKITERILGTLLSNLINDIRFHMLLVHFYLTTSCRCILCISGEIWKNPAFMTSTSRSEQSEGTYVTDVIIPLLRSSLGGDIVCLSTAERQSLASKARRSIRVDEERMGKKPDIMGLLKRDEKILELMYVESSRIICTNSKKVDDDVKLLRETLDGMSFIGASCSQPETNLGS